MFWPLAVWKVRHGLVGQCRVFGGSMEPVIPTGSRVTVEPIDPGKIELGDILAAEVRNATMLHLVKAIDVRRRRVEISGTSGPADGWTGFEHVYGICTRIGSTPVPGAQARAKPARGLRRIAVT